MFEKAKALKNKITEKVGKTIASPYVKYKESQMRTDNVKYGVVRDFNDKYKRGNAPQNTPEYRRHRAVVDQIAEGYAKKNK